MKLSTLLTTHNVTATGFPSIQGLSEHGNKDGSPALVSSLSPAILAAQGISEYYAVKFPRGATFNTTDELIAADLDVSKYEITQDVDTDGLDTVIASQHQATVDILLDQYGADTSVFAQVTADDIAGKHVVGTLPPFLLTHVAAYTAVTIKDFDRTEDGDLSADELQGRLQIADKAIAVKEVK